MTVKPPRRPRPSWLVVVHSAITVGLLAMMAWPERHVVIWTRHRCPSRESVGVEYTTSRSNPGMTQACWSDVEFRCRSDGQTIMFLSPGVNRARTFETMHDGDGWTHGFARDADVGVLLAGLFE